MTDQEYLWLSALLEEKVDDVPPQALERLERRGWIKKIYLDSDFCELTQRGLDALESEENTRNQISQQKAENDAQKAENQARAAKQRRKDARHDYRVSIISGIICIILTFIVEHFSAIRNFIEQLFKP